MLFVESDANTSLDSSLLYNPSRETFSVFQIAGANAQEYPLTTNDLRTLLLNHVAIDRPTGIPRKEFIPNLAGNYIIVDNETGEFSGTGQTTEGYRGTNTQEFPRVLTEADNGTTYDVQNWFSFSSPSIYALISGNYPKFHNLLNKAGMANTKEFRYPFLSDNEFYTVFIPSDAALDSAGVNSLPVAELRSFLQFHFVQGNMIFTDGKQPQQYYETARVDEKSTPFTTVYTNVYIRPGIDIIDFPGKDGSNYAEVQEAGNANNRFAGVNIGEDGDVFTVMYNNGVIHEINKALIKNELDTN
jgi:hypothetical protein